MIPIYAYWCTPDLSELPDSQYAAAIQEAVDSVVARCPELEDDRDRAGHNIRTRGDTLSRGLEVGFGGSRVGYKSALLAVLSTVVLACATARPPSDGADEPVRDAEIFQVLVAEHAGRSPVLVLIDPRPIAPEPVVLRPDGLSFLDDGQAVERRSRQIAAMTNARVADLSGELRCPPEASAGRESDDGDTQGSCVYRAFSLPWKGDLSDYAASHQRRLEPIVGRRPWVVRTYYLEPTGGARISSGVVDWVIGRVDGRVVVLETLGIAWLH